jgi:hypothetical protein
MSDKKDVIGIDFGTESGRALQQVDFSTLPIKDPKLRKKNSVTLHPPKGIAAHRRQKQAA